MQVELASKSKLYILGLFRDFTIIMIRLLLMSLRVMWPACWLVCQHSLAPRPQALFSAALGLVRHQKDRRPEGATVRADHNTAETDKSDKS